MRMRDIVLISALYAFVLAWWEVAASVRATRTCSKGARARIAARRACCPGVSAVNLT